MKALDKRLVRLLLSTKTQFLAVTVVLAIGLLTFTLTNFSVRNLENSVNQYYQDTNFADIFCEVIRMPRAQLTELAKIPGVEAVSGRVMKEVSVDNHSEKRATLRLLSYNEDSAVSDIYIHSGRPPVGDNEIMLLRLFAEANNVDVGDSLTLKLGGEKKTLNVSAIVSSPDYVYLIESAQALLPNPQTFGVGYITEQFAQRQFGFNHTYNTLYINTRHAVDETFIINQLEKVLDRYGVISVYGRDDQLSARLIDEEIKQNKSTAKVIPFVFIMVAALIIAVMINRLVKSDRIAIGVLKAMGYDNRAIILHYVKYGLLIGVLGSTIGMLIGIYLAFLITEYYKTLFDIPLMTSEFYPHILVAGISLGSAFCIFASLYGTKGVIGIDPAESMRPEAPKIGKRIALEKISWLWQRFSFSWKVVIRNMLRSKKRMIFIVSGVALTFAITLMPLYLVDSFYAMFERQYGEMYHMDYTIRFEDSVRKDALIDLKAITESKIAEPQIEFPFEVKRGWKSKSVNVIALNPQTELYSFHNAKGQAINIPERGIVLTEGLARVLSAEQGDWVTLSSYLPDRPDVDMPVTGIVKQQLGVNGYMALNYMQDMLLDNDYINSVAVAGMVQNAAVLDDFKNIQSVQSLSDMKESFKQFTQLTVTVYGIMIFCAGLLGFAIIYNATIMSINERQLEFSTIRVMGFDKKDIFMIVMRENVLLSMIGIVLGVPLGAKLVDGIAQAFSNELYTLEISNNPMLYVYTTLLVIIFVAIAQIATYNKIHYLNFIDALKARMT